MTNHTLHLGDNLATLKNYPDNHFDSIITDPPYGIAFLGKDWDSHTGTLELYKECLRVLKPGGYMLAFSAARTYHQLASNIELAGFEIRDQLMWLYSSGFPKAQDIGKAIQKRIGVEEFEKFCDTTKNVGFGQMDQARANQDIEWSTKEESVGIAKCTSPIAKQWEGFKSALKPAHEPIVMARKPFKGSTIDNVLKNGLGALNIDATRVPWADETEAEKYEEWKRKYPASTGGETFDLGFGESESWKKKKSDRESANYSREPGTNRFKGINTEAQIDFHIPGGIANREEPTTHDAGRYPSNVIGEVAEGYQKFFYNPKVSRKERHIGFENLPKRLCPMPNPDTGLKDIYDGYDLEGRKVAQVLSNLDMITAMGGHWIDEHGNKTDASAMYWAPHIGNTYAHGITKVYAEWCLANNKPTGNTGNNHPTVKPVALMDYLIKLVTPPSTETLQRKVLDPFMGSGSTGMAAVALGHHFTGCELDPKYVAIAETRITAWNTPEPEPEVEPDNNFGDLFGDVA